MMILKLNCYVFLVAHFCCHSFVSAFTLYRLKRSVIGNDFFSAFNWETEDDPTHGRVNYLDSATARERGLAYTSGSSFFMKADSTNIVPEDARGRDSIRINSKEAFEDSVIVLDIRHMPVGCGTWPAFWTLSQAGPWPQGGEIDIIEGVHNNNLNLASLHTTPNCTLPADRIQKGTSLTTDCDTSVNFNQGCGSNFSKTSSYGTGLNQVGGGWFVLQRSQQDGAKVWFWARNDPGVPLSVRLGLPDVIPDATWGLPEARMPTDTCDWNTHFNAHSIIFDLTFCGDWAGNTFTSAGCGANCVDFVNNNPSAFSEAYWEVKSLRIYTPLNLYAHRRHVFGSGSHP